MVASSTDNDPELSPTGTWRRLLKSGFARNLASLSGAALVSRLLGLATLGWAARHLGPDLYGQIGFGLSVTAYASIVLSPGLVVWGTRAVARDRDAAGRLLWIVNGTQLFLSLLGFAGAALFAWQSLPQPQEQAVVLLSALMLFTQALSADWVLNGLELSRITAGFNTVISILQTLALILWVRSPADLYHVPLIPFFAMVVAQVGTYWVLLRRLQIRLQRPSRDQVVQALRSSLPLGLMAAIVVVLHYANNLIVRGILGERDLGIYLAAYRLVEVAGTIPSVLAGAFLPRLARTVGGAPEQAAREAQLFARVHMVPALLGAALMCVEPHTIITVIYGERYAAAIPLLRVLAPALLFNYAICGYTNCLVAYGKDRVMLSVVVVSAIVSVGGGLLLVPYWGALGAAVAMAFVDLSGWAISLPAYRSAVGSLQLGVWRWPVAGALVVAATCLTFAALGVPWPVRLAAALLAYAPFVWLSFRDVRL